MRLKYASRELFQVGYVKKAHGHKGDVLVVLEDYPAEDLLGKESVFIRIDGLPVPFFIQEMRLLDDQSVKMKLEDVDHPDLARELSSRQVFLPAGNAGKSDIVTWEKLQGYSVFDTKGVVIGIVTAFESYSGNHLLVVDTGGRETLIPVNDQLVLDVDHGTKSLHMIIPEGLLDSNRED